MKDRNKAFSNKCSKSTFTYEFYAPDIHFWSFNQSCFDMKIHSESLFKIVPGLQTQFLSNIRNPGFKFRPNLFHLEFDQNSP